MWNVLINFGGEWARTHAGQYATKAEAKAHVRDIVAADPSLNGRCWVERV